MRKVLFLSLAMLAVSCIAGCFVQSAKAQNQQKPTLYLIGDSTVKNGRGDGSNGQWGWGDAIGLYFDAAKLNVENHALGGTSSRTYYGNETLWGEVVKNLKPGDFVIMQFGHNDGGAVNDNSRARGTLSGIGEETEEIDNMLTGKHEIVHTYGWYIAQFIKETKAKGATPIVCSLIPRNDWDEPFKMRPGGGNYVQWAKAVAEREKVGYIDLSALSVAALQKEGQEVVTGKYYLASDHTHTTGAGAMLNASLIAGAIRTLSGCPLIPFLLDQPSGTFPVKKQLFIVGDSTVANGSGSIVGWGKPIVDMFDSERITVYNKARGGRSSRTFLNEGLWDEIMQDLKAGDFVLIGFGHNDGSAIDDAKARGSLKGTGDETQEVTKADGTKETVHTFGWYMRKYVQDIKAKGATAILFSQIPWQRMQGGKAARVTETYGKWLKEIADSEGVLYIDLNDLLATKYEALGDEGIKPFSYGDGTHTTLEGAIFNAQGMIEGLRAARSPLTSYLSRTAGQQGGQQGGQNRPQGQRPQGQRPQGGFQGGPQGAPQGGFQGQRPQGGFQGGPQGQRPQGQMPQQAR